MVTKKMKMGKRGLIFAIMLPAIGAVVFASALLSGQTTSTEAIELQDVPSVSGALSAKQMFEKGYATDLVVAKLDQDTISAKRGETVTIPVTIEHMSNSKDSPTVTLSNFQNVFRNFAPSAREGLSDDEFEESVHGQAAVKGEISINDHIIIRPSEVNLAPNSSATIVMEVTIPSDLPAEMLNKSITIGLSYDMEPHSEQIRGVAPSITIMVVE